MDDRSRIPTFNMKVVVQETGIKPDTLRAWERRYDLPNPHRTSGGHRLYSQRDIDMLRWFMARQDEGLSIKRAVNLWQQIEAEGRDPLLVYETDHPEVALPKAVSGDSSTLRQMRRDWINACMAFDAQTAQTILAEAFAMFPAETVVMGLLRKGIAEIGESWFEGNISVQQEHFASEIALRQVEALLASAASLQVTQTGKLIVVCPPEEQHTFGPLTITLLLRRRGWDVVYLGANTPINELEGAIHTIQPRLVIFSAQSLRTASTLLDAAEYLAELDIPVAFGGYIFVSSPELVEYIPGYYLGEAMEAIPERIAQFMRDPDIEPVDKKPSQSYLSALEDFRSNRSTIESKLMAKLSQERFKSVSLSIINQDFGNDIDAALRLGNLQFMNDNLVWLRELMENKDYPKPNITLNIFLQAYYNAAAEVLSDKSDVFLQWLASKVENEQLETQA